MIIAYQSEDSKEMANLQQACGQMVVNYEELSLEAVFRRISGLVQCIYDDCRSYPCLVSTHGRSILTDMLKRRSLPSS